MGSHLLFVSSFVCFFAFTCLLIFYIKSITIYDIVKLKSVTQWFSCSRFCLCIIGT